MGIKKNCTIFPSCCAKRNQKGTLYYVSFKFLCLSLYIIGFYYVLFNNSLENGSLEIAKNCNIYKRNLVQEEKVKVPKKKKNLKYKKGDVIKVKSNETDIKCNEEVVAENDNSSNNCCANNNAESESNVSICNINYNDMSKNLTEKELYEVLNSFKECPPKEDLRNIWNHTLSVVKQGFDNIFHELKVSIQENLDNDIDLGDGKLLYNDIWSRLYFNYCRELRTEEAEYIKKFYRLINDKSRIDKSLNFIYSFLEHFNTFKGELKENFEKELSKEIKKSANS
ncbi:exported protein (PHISTa) [Plasmodium gaboni]|uniref:Exported protein (PHISTa) n=1 Tax=Plasmodium gaboni TaxID=647221 RepID=A0A151LUS9_9APIC|nr:exported protein (PHISTa) [Plasmodium gaboni]KYO02932.1 exported protein (PHISTa) [Plasmodium gaboni]SOV11466.1 Plasmodium exported protein (PHISTa), unknown function [Plasmodium gaboni]SOV21210.1 Plasmodium exported protein (PHISTa), unknown function [Plasmodium sp. DRC-Itaito]